MKERGTDPRAVEVTAWCRHGDALQGEWPLSGMERLVTALAEAPAGDVAWSAQGSQKAVVGSEAENWVELTAHTVVALQCQRCLQSYPQPLEVQRRIRFVADEAEAVRLDEISDDDVLPMPVRLDLHQLVEDELILALPIVPRHEVCPEPLPLPAADPAADAEAPNPFAALAALRGRVPR